MTPAYIVLIAVVSIVALVSGCVFYPREVDYYDAECDITTRRLVLDTVVIEGSCAGTNSYDPNNDKACLALIVAVGAASAIVSGSIVVVGNTVSWLEKTGRCAVDTGSRHST